jgi:thymidylate synthase
MLNYYKTPLCEIHPEFQYLCLLEKVLNKGALKKTRNGNTISLFGEQLTFRMTNSHNEIDYKTGDHNFYKFPLLTTKRTYWFGIIEELLWFLKGCTNANELAVKNVHIWDGNGSREFLDSRGLNHYPVGELGPVYGYQWRNFGKPYKNEQFHGIEQFPGIDQISEIIQMIKNDPNSRRMVVSAWNPVDLSKMALPPCHMFFQVYVNDNNYLDIHMYQRSVDLFLGEPFNIASYYLLLCILCQYTSKIPGDITISMGDIHIYEDHLQQVKQQLQRLPLPFPVLKINKILPELNELINEPHLFELLNYNFHPGIKAKMNI